MANAVAALECPEFSVDDSRECLPILLPRPNGIEDGGGRKGESARLNTCEACGWSKPKGVEPTCAHAARGPMSLLSPPYERTKPLVPGIEGHDSAASVMPWWGRRWANPIRGDEPQESDNIQRARNRALAAAIRASGNPRISAWGRHNDPVKGLMLVTGAVLDLQLDSAGQWAWKRDHGVAWDDTERRGRIPAGRHVDAGVDNATDGNGLVDPAKLLHPRWRRHLEQPDTKAGYVYLARWARDRAGRLERVHVTDDGVTIYMLNRHPDRRLVKDQAPKSRKGPRFSPALLAGEARARWEQDNDLQWVQERGRRRLNLGAYADGAKLDHEGHDGGWAHHLGVRRADVLLARKRARRRVERDALAYAEHGISTDAAEEVDHVRLQLAIWEGAQHLPRESREVLHFVLEAVERESGRPGHPEHVLAWLADRGGIATADLRSGLAYCLAPLRARLRRWGRGRTGGWVPAAEPLPGLTPTDVFKRLFDPAPRDGRPPDYDPRLAGLAIWLADGVMAQLDIFTALALEGHRQAPAAAVVAGLQDAMAIELAIERRAFGGTPPRLQQADVEAAVARVGYGRAGAVGKVTFELAAQAYGLPRKALEAAVRRAK